MNTPTAPPTVEKQPGKIITFYSYKGGTGRSMALANVAWVLASNGYRVLTVDWDLEAPGLHRYFAPFLLDPELSCTEGVMDFVTNYVTAALTPPEADAANAEDGNSAKWYEPHANVLRYAASLDWKFQPQQERKGWLDLMPAGRQDPSYATRMNLFSWQNFYDRLGGGGFIEAARQKMQEEYDYILIDSRTGVSDTSGICTVQLPDILAVCFTLNRQSIEGAGAVAAAVEAQRRENAEARPLRIFPIPTRVEKAEKDKLDLAREAAKEKFAPFLGQLSETQQAEYWGNVEVFYEPFYAYEEVLATFGDKPLQTNSLLASMERITGWLTDQQVTQLVSVSEPERQRVLAKYARQSRKTKVHAPAAGQEYLFYLSYARTDLDESLERFFDDLRHTVQKLTGRPASEAVGFVDLDLAPGVEWEKALSDALQRSRVLVPIYSPAYFESQYTGREFQHFLLRAHDDAPNGILPVWWSTPGGTVPEAAARIYHGWPNFSTYDRFGLRQLLRVQRYAEEYRGFVEALAKRLVELVERAAPVAPAVADFNAFALPNAFAPTVESAPPPPVPAEAEMPADVQKFVKALATLDRQEVLDGCEAQLLPYLRQRSTPYPLAEADDLLQKLNQRRFFDLMETVASVLVENGQDDPLIQRRHAQALLAQGKLTAAKAVLTNIKHEQVSGPFDWAAVCGLWGEIYKQLYVEAAAPALPRNQQNLAQAIKAFDEAHELNPQNHWYGINSAALLLRARRDGVRLANYPEPERQAAVLAQAILARIEEQISAGEAHPWDYANAAEACLALGLPEESLKWVSSFIQEPTVDAHVMTELLRQLTEVWQLDAATGIGQQILPTLQAELLKREGGSVKLTVRAAAPTWTKIVNAAVGMYEKVKVFGADSYVSLQWYQTGVERSQAVARIETKEGEGYGSGFLLRGGDLVESFGDELLLLTAAHVVSPAENHFTGALPPEDARISFEALRLKGFAVAELLFTSPPTELDVTLLKLDRAVAGVTPYPIAKKLPLPDGTSRVYIMGYPGGGRLSFSLNDNLLLDHQAPRIHYRTSAEAGSSGSPVFNQSWQLIGLHHARGAQMPRLNGKPGTYEANEGIWIQSIIEAVRKKFAASPAAQITGIANRSARRPKNLSKRPVKK